MRIGIFFVVGLAFLTACKTTSGDTEIKNFHITEIVLLDKFNRGTCLSTKAHCDRLRAEKMPVGLRTKLNNALHHYAAAHNQLQPNAQLAYRLEVSVTGLSYESCSAAATALTILSAGELNAKGAGGIRSESQLVDTATGAVVRKIKNSNSKVIQSLTCSKESQDNGFSKNMSKYILRRANLLKKTPKSVEKILANVDVLQPRLQPISPLVAPGTN